MATRTTSTPTSTSTSTPTAAHSLPAFTRTHTHTWRRDPRLVALVVLLLWSSWIALFFVRGRDPRDLATIGRVPLSQSHVSSVIRIDPSYHYYPGGIGYDGQYNYFLALDPANARYYMDYPSYRYTRILYPLLARLFAGGNAAFVPYTLLLLNLLALTAGTFLVAHWLRKQHISPWLALLYGCSPGLAVALQPDLGEPLAYGLAVAGCILLDSPRPRLGALAALPF